MSFNFGFAGDDIETSQDNEAKVAPGTTDETQAQPAPVSKPDVPVVQHAVHDLLHTLPSNISYTTTHITSHLGRSTLVPRRALFDVRIQIMAESPMSPDLNDQGSPNQSHASPTRNQAEDPIGLSGNSDIERDVYEGGFKSWEGAMDLTRFLLDRGPRKDVDEIAGLDGIVELGAGTSLPSLLLYQHALRNSYRLPFTLADYNASVLRLVTLPNLLLVWALEHSPDSFSPEAPALVSMNADSDTPIQRSEGDLDVTSALLSSFLTHSQQNNPLTLLSGPWSPPLSTHVLRNTTPASSILVLASEVLYSPDSLRTFAKLLSDVLGRVRAGKALVAGKRVYFGVGGGVGEFKDVMAGLGGVVSEIVGAVEEKDDGGGVGRCICEVQMF